MRDKFDDIRPYTQEEIPAAMQRIADSEYFPIVMKYVYPDEDLDVVRNMIRSITTIEQFQYKVMYDAYKAISNNTITSFTYSGVETVDKEIGYLYISNHRDIVLDSYLLQYAFYSESLPTCETTFGENLMSNQFIIDIGKSNRMFKVYRSGNLREFMEHSKQLSEYIRNRIVELNTSIWISQRNGRTKDGVDVTEQGLTKMLGMSGNKTIQSYLDLNIRPMAISYEIEPCDALKTQEVYLTRLNGSYVKSPYEDINSILTGLTQKKGEIHISLAPPISAEDFDKYQSIKPSHLNKIVADIIDKKIRSHYKLFANNYIAHDIRSQSNQFAEHYTKEQKGWFVDHLEHSIAQLSGDKDVLSSIFLGIYANPVDSVISTNDECK